MTPSQNLTPVSESQIYLETPSRISESVHQAMSDPAIPRPFRDLSGSSNC